MKALWNTAYAWSPAALSTAALTSLAMWFICDTGHNIESLNIHQAHPGLGGLVSSDVAIMLSLLCCAVLCYAWKYVLTPLSPATFRDVSRLPSHGFPLWGIRTMCTRQTASMFSDFTAMNMVRRARWSASCSQPVHR